MIFKKIYFACKNLMKKINSVLNAPDTRFYPKGMNSLVDGSVPPELVEIGTGFVSAPNSVILAHDASTITHCGKMRIEKTTIGKNVFLGMGAIVLPGINIGDNVIVGAGSIVTKDIPSGVIVAGNPARIMSTVDEYIKKCEAKDVLYSLPDCVREKHGTLVRYLPDEIAQIKSVILEQYNQK